MSLQKNIAFILIQKKLPYGEFGKMVGATEGQIKTYLKGTTPPVNILCSIADFAGISLDTLLRKEITAENYIDFREPALPYDIAAQIQQRIGFVLKLMLRERSFGKYTLKGLQKISQLPESRFKQLMEGETVSITADAIISIVEHLHVNANWILTGKGALFNETNIVQGLQKLTQRVELLETKRSK